VPEQDTNSYRLSPQQEYLWSLQQLDQSRSYYVRGAIRIDGLLDLEMLRAAFASVINRHEILRTTFQIWPGTSTLLQTISESGSFSFDQVDLSGLNQQEQEAAVDELFNKPSRLTFNLSDPPCLRPALIVLSVIRHILIIDLPALCADTTTLKNLVREINGAYEACLGGEELPAAPLQYVDVAEWQNQLLESAEARAARDYWRRPAIAAHLQVQLPYEDASAAGTGFSPRSLVEVVPPETVLKIDSIVQQRGVLVSDFLLTCWQVLLWRLTGELELTIGTAVEDRNHAELENVFGPVAQYLPLHIRLEDDLKFSDVLDQACTSRRRLAQRREYFTWDDVRPTPDEAIRPAFPFVSFDFEHDSCQYSNRAVSFSISKQYACLGRFKLRLRGFRRKSSLTVEVHYDPDRFQAAEIKRLNRQFLTLLTSACAKPDSMISALEILDPDERRRLLVELNQTSSEYPRDKCVHQLFEEQVKRTPHQIAIVCQEQQLTYAELDLRADYLAQQLRTLGAKPETLVGICIQPSVEMLVAILGVLKAGAAYVPLDPTYPQERLVFMLDDAQPSVLLTQQCLATDLPEHKAKTIFLDGDWASLAATGSRYPVSRVAPENAAYVIYTSGSTGRPKGVVVPHRGLVNYLSWCAHAYQLTSGQGAPVHSSLGFDLTVTSIFAPLLTGRTVFLLPGAPGAEPLCEALCSEVNFSFLKLTPSHLEVISRLLPGAAAKRTALLIVGGEALRGESLSFWREHAPETRIINEYGPTEAVVGCCVYEVPSGLSRSGAVPIGRPIANTQLYVLDSRLEPVPFGVTGELYIGGSGVARGYLNQPQQTAERFVPHPFSDRGGDLLYKTGDLARYLLNGNLEFHGRADTQVKLRGYRIELGEIETRLKEHPSVQDSAVILREDIRGDQRIVAYAVFASGAHATTTTLLQFLAAKLPDYMLPASFVTLKHLPLTAHGKVDRRALPPPTQERPEIDQPYVPARTAVEASLAEIWAQVLGLEQSGIHDNFFQLGGHSLLATQLISQIRNVLRVEVSLRKLFDSPTVAALAEEIERLMRAGAELDAPPPIRVARGGQTPLSFGQQRLWFLDRLEPNSSAYNIPAAVRLTGSLNLNVLELSINEIVRRHEALRTTFAEMGGQPVQVVAPELVFRPPLVDLGHLADREAAALRLATQEAQQPFDLGTGPLLRITLLRLGPEDHVVLLTMHHIVSDGWSMDIFVREFAALYEVYLAGQESSLPELPIQYRDYAAWQRDWFRGEVLARQLASWKRQLGGTLPVLELPADHARPAVQGSRGAVRSFDLTQELSNGLKELSQKAGATLYMTLLAAFQTLLYRYTGQDDIIVGTPIAGRTRVELEGLIGFFVNMLALRTDLSGNPSFRDLIARVREVALEAYANQDLPFEKLVEELQPRRDLSRNPLFQVLFALQNVPVSQWQIPDLKINYLEVDNETTRFDLALRLIETPVGLKGAFEYNTDLFAAESIDRLALHFQHVVAALSADPGRPIGQIALLSHSERQQLVVVWNRTEEPYEARATLHELFAAQAARTPKAVAVTYERQQISYEDLDHRANRLAHYLLRCGVRLEMPVGILLERSIEMIISMLGILKAGAAYLPLDPGYPRQRLRLMVEDAGLQWVISRYGSGEWLSETGVAIVDVDSDWEPDGPERTDDLESGAAGENLAYIIYTSGSTGRPKGVMISHQALINFLRSTSRRPGLTSRDVLLAVTTLSFDIAALELFLPLINGGRVVIASRETAVDGQRLAEKLAESRATVMQATPSTWRVLLAAGWTGGAELKILCGGEALDWPLANQLIERCGEIWNMYGPTETTVWSTLYNVEKTSTRSNVVSIGRPLDNTELYVLDSNMQLLPIGVDGELYIGGAGLSRGYWRGPNLTADRFLPHPFSDRPGARLYRTGDVARYLSDGNVQYVGRADQQVKVRGYRIELEEVEAVLNEQPQVHESVVIVREDEPGDRRLVGYVVPEPEQNFSEADARRYLRERLPEYMVPAALVKLEKLPLTPNGKVDRSGLLAPAQLRPHSEETFNAPRTAVEEIVAGLWARVLDRQEIGVNDNFFALGGHSLLVTQVISRVQAVFEVELPLRSLFEAPTVLEFVGRIEEAQTKGPRTTMPALQRVARGGRAPLTFAQQRLWFLNQLEPESTAYNLATALSVKGSLDLTALEQSFNQLSMRHETLRTTFGVDGVEPVQLIADQLPIRLTVEDLQLAEGEWAAEVARLASEEARHRFDLSTGPLLRIRLLRLTEQEQVLLLTMHHIISDGWSMALMVQELGLLYEACVRRRPAALEELSIQYGDYAVWQQQWLSGVELDRQLAFWEQQLAGGNYVLEMPTDWPRPALQSHHGATHTGSLSEELTQKLKTLSRRESSTLFMTLLAAFRTLLFRYTGQPDVLIGVPIANRTHPETEPLIGYFANTLVLRSDVAAEMSFSEVLKRVRDMALGAYAHQDVPFEKVVEKLRPERDLGRNPLFQVFFGFQNVAPPTIDLEDLTLSTLDSEIKATRFDLALAISPVENSLRFLFEYNTALFEHQTITRMAGHFVRLVEGIVADPERRLSEFSLLSEAESDQLINGWNPAPANYHPPRCVHELFAAQVGRAPEAIALRFEQRELSFRELNRRANQLAYYLRARGVKAESTVAICLERSLNLIISLLAVLKAGGAYVPVDPAYPPQRLRLILEDAGVAALVTEEELVARLEPNATPLICLDREWAAISREAEADPTGGVSAENLAYVIYTSGSTGQPKGVQITHRNLVSLLEAKETLFAFDEHDIWTVFHSFTFDLSVWEIFTPLVYGSRLVVVPLRVVQSPKAFYDLLRTEQVTILHQTPSLMRHLLRFIQTAGLEVTRDLKLRLIICGGEALPSDLAAELLEWQIPVWNFYGPTEATVWATKHQVDRSDPQDAAASIGRPLSNSEIFILDSEQNLVPVGIVGELCVGGHGLARAYLNAPAETARKFIPHPFATRPGARLYRTGDLARYLPDGRIRYLGRTDQQVKLRGYRIELGEIEAALAEHPSVKECVVATDETVDDQGRLVAYVTERDGAAKDLSLAEMRQYLEQRLPWYMVPTALVKVERMPLTRSGKVDRRALRAVAVVAGLASQPYLEPRNLDEALLAGIWANVLGLERVGINDNFFELGGHSLLSPGIISRVKEIFDTELPLRILFEAPTVAALAQRIKRQARIEAESPSWSPLVAIQQSGAKRPFFCVHPGGGGVSCYRDLSRLLGVDQPFYGLQAAEVSEGDSGEYEYQSLEQTAADYWKAVRAAQPEGPYLIGGWSAGGVIAFEMAQQLKRIGEEVALLALLDSMPRSLGKGKVDDGALAFLVAREIATNAKKSLTVSFDDLQKLGPDDQVSCLLDQLKLANVLPQEMQLSWFRRILKGIWTRNEHLDQYRPQVYPGRITLFRGSEIDPDFIKAQNALDWTEIDAFDPTNGWSKFSSEPIEVHEVPGHHYTIVREPQVRILAAKLSACLERAG